MIQEKIRKIGIRVRDALPFFNHIGRDTFPPALFPKHFQIATPSPAASPSGCPRTLQDGVIASRRKAALGIFFNNICRHSEAIPSLRRGVYIFSDSSGSEEAIFRYHSVRIFFFLLSDSSKAKRTDVCFRTLPPKEMEGLLPRRPQHTIQPPSQRERFLEKGRVLAGG